MKEYNQKFVPMLIQKFNQLISSNMLSANWNDIFDRTIRILESENYVDDAVEIERDCYKPDIDEVWFVIADTKDKTKGRLISIANVFTTKGEAIGYLNTIKQIILESKFAKDMDFKGNAKDMVLNIHEDSIDYTLGELFERYYIISHSVNDPRPIAICRSKSAE